MKKRLGLLLLGLATVLVACGQLAHATAGPEPNDLQDSPPAWTAGARLDAERTRPDGTDMYVAASNGVFRGVVPNSTLYVARIDALGAAFPVFVGTGNDTIVGGPGRDRINCAPGGDTVEGAGRLDRIAKSCERVRR